MILIPVVFVNHGRVAPSFLRRVSLFHACFRPILDGRLLRFAFCEDLTIVMRFGVRAPLRYALFQDGLVQLFLVEQVSKVFVPIIWLHGLLFHAFVSQLFP